MEPMGTLNPTPQASPNPPNYLLKGVLEPKKALFLPGALGFHSSPKNAPKGASEGVFGLMGSLSLSLSLGFSLLWGFRGL